MIGTTYDAVVIGAGPNGLTAAAILVSAGLSVAVLERNATIGGSCRTEALTLPGFAHDVCGAIHPMGVVSPIFRRLSLQSLGLTWVSAPLPVAHPLDDRAVGVLSRDVDATSAALGDDGDLWRRLVQPFVDRSDAFFSDVLRPVRWPRHPALLARFGAVGLRSCLSVAQRFRGDTARALLAGNCAHAFLPLDEAGSAS